MAPPLIETTVVGTYPLAPRVQQLVLRADDHTFSHEPGQHVNVRMEADGSPVYRPYSPVSGPGTETLVLAVKRYDNGTCSVWLHERSVGDPVPLMPPSGNLQLRDPTRDALFLATGTGLTPMLSMLTPYLRAEGGHATLLYGERTQADLMYRAMLDRLAATYPSLSVTYVLSGEAWDGPTGHVQDHLAPALDRLDAPHAYACGVPEMVVDTNTALQDAGVPADHILTEGWEEGAVADD
ncbi:MAG: phenol hydroxylase [Bacteroidetes bacterium SW_9_63_38]|nr:MAG: phenol hydroxylase [Bacteroidetes bacterium SW_9_63_38]